jgi:hypothetical protein
MEQVSKRDTSVTAATVTTFSSATITVKFHMQNFIEIGGKKLTFR